MASAEKSNPQETVVDGDHEEKDQNQTAEQTEPERTEDEKRVRTLTNKGKELYENEVQKYSAKIDKIWNDIENIPSEIENIGNDIKALRALASNLDDMGKRYEKENKMFFEYLTRTNTSESQKELDSQKATFDKGKDIIQNLRKRIRDSRMEITESVSKSSQGTMSSSVRSMLFMKRMEAESQRANVQFREKELCLLKQKASLREMEARYINDHSDDKFDIDPFSTCDSESVFSQTNHEKSNNKETPTIQKSIIRELSSQNIKTPESRTVVSDLTRFLLKKDLLFSRFSHFNDKPETFTT